MDRVSFRLDSSAAILVTVSLAAATCESVRCSDVNLVSCAVLVARFSDIPNQEIF